jgi:hypothetical protein
MTTLRVLPWLADLTAGKLPPGLARCQRLSPDMVGHLARYSQKAERRRFFMSRWK